MTETEKLFIRYLEGKIKFYTDMLAIRPSDSDDEGEWDTYMELKRNTEEILSHFELLVKADRKEFSVGCGMAGELPRINV
jgi:hypothetical protein